MTGFVGSEEEAMRVVRAEGGGGAGWEGEVAISSKESWFG